MNRRGAWITGAALLVIALAVLIFWLQGPDSTRLLTRLFSRQDLTWTEMQARKTWRVGLDPSFPPFEFLDEAGVAVGYDLDLARAIADQLLPIGETRQQQRAVADLLTVANQVAVLAAALPRVG